MHITNCVYCLLNKLFDKQYLCFCVLLKCIFPLQDNNVFAE